MGPPRHGVIQEPHQHLLSYHRLRKANLRNSIGTHLTNFTSPLLQLQLPLVSLLPCVLTQLTREGTSEVDAEGENGKTARFTCSSKEGWLWDATSGRASWTLMLKVSHGERFRTHLSFPGRMCKRGFIGNAVDISRAAAH